MLPISWTLEVDPFGGRARATLKTRLKDLVEWRRLERSSFGKVVANVLQTMDWPLRDWSESQDLQIGPLKRPLEEVCELNFNPFYSSSLAAMVEAVMPESFICPLRPLF